MISEKANIKGSMGGYGGEIQSTGTHNGNYCAIKALETSTVTVTGNISGFTSIPILGGDCVPGEFTSVTVTSGKVILYYSVSGV